MVMEKYLIVNGDDYGLTEGVSAGIRQAHLEGILTSTSAMMNQPGTAGAIRTAHQVCPSLGIGVHLVLTNGAPCLPADRVPSLVRSDGGFYKQGELLRRLAQVDPQEALAEWRAQVERFVDAAGRLPDHLDAHHHISYASPELLGAMLDLAEELGCPVRRAYDALQSVYLPEPVRSDRSEGIAEVWNRRQPHSTDVFLDGFYGEIATPRTLKAMIDRIAADEQNSTFEIMCHPARVDDALRQTSSYNEQRGLELAALTHPGLAGAVAEHKIFLASFGVLQQNG
jgi:predicted glycoside hydrolase/deacetylase ChbG (UPF0249 family)